METIADLSATLADVTSAVDGIKDPTMAGPVGSAFAVFLSDDGVAGELLLDPATDQLFSLAIGNGNRRVIGFEIGANPGLKVT